MSQPIKHHFLPQWYIERWTSDRVVWEFRRPGPENKLSTKYRFPAGTGYQPHLYSLPGLPLEKAVTIERDFLQLVDDRAAKALRKLETERTISPDENDWLAEFICSMLHRSPGRIDYLQERLRSDLSPNDLFDGVGDEYYRHYALEVFLDLVQSDTMNQRLGAFKAFTINLGSEGFDLLTSDRPLILSGELHHRDAFVALPTSPRRLLFLAERRAVAERFAGRTARQLSRAVNDTIVRQAEAIVISQTGREAAFVDKRLGKRDTPIAGLYQDSIGLVRWQI